MVKKKNKTKKEAETNYLALGISLGVALGAAFGIAVFENAVTGIGIGLPLGIAFGVTLDEKEKRKKKK